MTIEEFVCVSFDETNPQNVVEIEVFDCIGI